MPLCRGCLTLTHVLSLLTYKRVGAIRGRSVGKPGVVVFVILYDSTFLFYFDVVCETVSFFKASDWSGQRDCNVLGPTLADTILARLVPEDTLLSVTGACRLNVQYTHPIRTMSIYTCEDLLIEVLLKSNKCIS